MLAIKVKKLEWLKLGVERFAKAGAEGINVEQMAKRLKCNKSSFYWHFKSKKNFLDEMIMYWFENSVKPITDKLSNESDPNKKFDTFLRLSFHDKSRKDFMFFLRKMAQSNSQLQELLDSLTAKRLAFTSLLIQDLGYSETESKYRAEILFNFYIGWYEINKYENSQQQIQEDINYAVNLVKGFINF